MRKVALLFFFAGLFGVFSCRSQKTCPTYLKNDQNKETKELVKADKGNTTTHPFN